MATLGNGFVGKVCKLVKLSDERLKPFRADRRILLEQYAGTFYGNHRTADGMTQTGPEPRNVLQWIASSLIPSLVYRNEICGTVKTQRIELEREARLLTAVFDATAKAIKLGRRLRELVEQSMTGPGIAKVGNDERGPWVGIISLDDYIIDPIARSQEGASFQGNRYRVSRAAVLEEGIFDNAAIERLTSFWGNSSTGERAETLSQAVNSASRASDVEEMIELMQVYIPSKQVILTLPGDQDEYDGPALAETPYIGPACGPYPPLLGYHWLPDNALPMSPLGLMHDHHVEINKTARKIGRRADSQKEIAIYDRVAAEDAENVARSIDGDLVGVTNTDKFKQISLGADPAALFELLQEQFAQVNRFAHNPDMQGGTATPSNTLGQDQLLQSNSNNVLEDMRRQVQSVGDAIGESIVWYLVNDRQAQPKPVVMTYDSLSIPAVYSAEELHGTFDDFQFSVDLYNEAQLSPNEQFQSSVRFVAAMSAIAAAQGRTFDLDHLVSLARRVIGTDAPRLMPSAPQQMAPQTMPAEPMQHGADQRLRIRSSQSRQPQEVA